MLSIPQALRRIKGNCADAVPEALIRQICDELDYSFRQRRLTPVVTTYLFLQQILHGNTAVGDLRHRSGLDFTDSAYCQARARLPLAFFRRLQRAVAGNCRTADSPDPAARWHRHRLFLLDGSSFSMPDTPELQEAFGQPGAQAPGCGSRFQAQDSRRSAPARAAQLRLQLRHRRQAAAQILRQRLHQPRLPLRHADRLDHVIAFTMLRKPCGA